MANPSGCTVLVTQAAEAGAGLVTGAVTVGNAWESPVGALSRAKAAKHAVSAHTEKQLDTLVRNAVHESQTARVASNFKRYTAAESRLSIMETIKSQYMARLEKDIASCFEFDSEKGFYTGAIGSDLFSLWSMVEDFSDSFEERTEAFFILFKELLRRGHLKLQRDDKIIEHTPEEWEQIFRQAWPENDYPYGAYEGDICLWFSVGDTCPAYAVWIDPEDGSEYWAG